MKYTPVRSYTRICPICATKVSIGFSELYTKGERPAFIKCPMCREILCFLSDYGVLRPDVIVRYASEKDAEDKTK